jgi:hypothetical protein
MSVPVVKALGAKDIGEESSRLHEVLPMSSAIACQRSQDSSLRCPFRKFHPAGIRIVR